LDRLILVLLFRRSLRFFSRLVKFNVRPMRDNVRLCAKMPGHAHGLRAFDVSFVTKGIRQGRRKTQRAPKGCGLAKQHQWMPLYPRKIRVPSRPSATPQNRQAGGRPGDPRGTSGAIRAGEINT